MERLVTSVALALMAFTSVLAAAIVIEGVLSGAPERLQGAESAAMAPTAPGPASVTTRETSVTTWDAPWVYVGYDDPPLVSRAVPIGRTQDTTGVLFEFQYSNSTPALGDGRLLLEVTLDGAILNVTSDRDERGVLTAWVHREQLRDGGIVVARVRAQPWSTTPNAVVTDWWALYITKFSGGDPDYTFTAVPKK